MIRTALCSQRTVSSDDGSFRIVDVPRGVWDVGVAPPDARKSLYIRPEFAAKSIAPDTALIQNPSHR